MLAWACRSCYSPLRRDPAGPLHLLSYPIHQTTSLHAVTSMSAVAVPPLRWSVPDDSAVPGLHFLERKPSTSDSLEPLEFAYLSDESYLGFAWREGQLA